MTRITTEMVIDAMRELAVEDYLAGESIASICRRTGFKTSTFGDYLQRIGAHQAGRSQAPKDYCARGHSMAIHGKPNSGNKGGRYCSECKRIRERVK